MLNYRINPEIASNCLNIKQLKLIYIYIYIKYLEINRLHCFFLFPFNFQGGAAARRASVLPCAFGIQGFQNLICNDITKQTKRTKQYPSVASEAATAAFRQMRGCAFAHRNNVLQVLKVLVQNSKPSLRQAQ